MDVSHAPTPISPEDLVAMTCAFPGPQILDVRRDSAFTAAETSLPGALRRDPEAVDAWSGDLEPHREVVTACVHGHQVSQGVAAALAAKGFRVRYLAGGIDGWTSLGFPTVPKPGSPTVWITRARPKIDRIACPWLIRRFVDPDARILYVPSAEVERVAQATGGTAFDVPGAPYTHENESCSFDMFVARHRNQDAALAILARIVRGADTERPDFHPAASACSPHRSALLCYSSPTIAPRFVMVWCSMTPCISGAATCRPRRIAGPLSVPPVRSNERCG